ncbi:ATP-binding protein [Maridesulfovibrio sp.]|uniref:two-component system sensor histidine kinase NtrB n=1 Tax=Maridesulfovibrio sp. TaxID=2795000 RepID=UPI002AA90D03|nr:ATP-binding protein [Maridesulfovibrio sp.]
MNQGNKNSLIAHKIAAIYALFGFLWILLSDKLLNFLVSDPNLIQNIQTFKGWLYVLITAGIIYLLVDKYDRSIQKSQNAYRRLLENLVDPIYLMNSEGIIIDINDAASLALGYSRKEIIGMPLDQIDPDLNLNQWIKTVAQIEQDIHLKTETRHRRKDGSIFPVEVVGCIFEEDGKRYCLGVARDITHRIHALELMVQNEKMNSMSGMAAGIAHEINNPLSAILGACQNITNRLFTDTPKNLSIAKECNTDLEAMRAYIRKRDILRMIKSISDAGERASKIIASMLNFSRDASREMKPCAIQDILDESLELISSDFSFSNNSWFKKTRIIKKYPPQQVHICCIRSELQQVIMNLVKNASEAMAEKKYSPEEQPTLDLMLKKEEQHIVIEITDNGPGIPEKILKKIFDPFYTTKGANAGTGLGLSISYFIITEQHKGSLIVSSPPGKGTKFTIRLPEKSSYCELDV